MVENQRIYFIVGLFILQLIVIYVTYYVYAPDYDKSYSIIAIFQQEQEHGLKEFEVLKKNQSLVSSNTVQFFNEKKNLTDTVNKSLKPKSIEAIAFDYIENLLSNCSNDFTVIRPSKDVGLGLALTEIIQLVNVVLSYGKTPRVDASTAIWFNGQDVTILDTINLPCRISDEVIYNKNEVLRCTGICPVQDTIRRVWIPDQFVLLGYRWWYKQLSRAIIRPSSALLGKLHKSNALSASFIRSDTFSINQTEIYDPLRSPFSAVFNISTLEKPLVALHIRKGDSCTEIRPECVNDATYVFEKLKRNNVTFGTLLVATESVDILEEILEDYRSYNFSNVVSFKVDRGLYDSLYNERTLPIEDVKDLHIRIAETDLVLEALLDIALLSLGDIHVGSFYSNFIRIGMSLAPQKNSFTDSKYITFDSDFCPFESCRLGWISKTTCPRWHKHLCQWRDEKQCKNDALPEYKVHNCGILAGSSCSSDCFLFTLSKRSYKLADGRSESFRWPRHPNTTGLVTNLEFWEILQSRIKDKSIFNKAKENIIQQPSKFWTEQAALLTYPFYFVRHKELQNIFVSDDICCKNTCIESSFLDQTEYGEHCLDISTKLEEVSGFINEYVYKNKIDLLTQNILQHYTKVKEEKREHYVLEKAPSCDERYFETSVSSKESQINRAKVNVFDYYSSEDMKTLLNSVPSENCQQNRYIPNFKVLKEDLKRSSSAIVYLAQKKHSSYGTNSLGQLQKSLKLLYKNFNAKYKYDVIIFHSGEFVDEDLVLLRNIDGIERLEINLIELKGKFWELPGFLMNSNQKKWEDDQFSVGYRHMCRWYAGLLFEFVHKMGYEYVMRFDEDSFLLSSIDYDIFEYMKRNEIEYGFRQDALEPCCDLQFRERIVKEMLDVVGPKLDKSVFKDIIDREDYDSLVDGFYGYYNNFFITKVGFWMQPRVRKLFNFIDWTGAFYLQRENDLFVQAFTVQLFMKKNKIKKFTDFSYQHITGANKGKCDWGALSIGHPSYSTNRTNSDLEGHLEVLKKTNSKIKLSFNNAELTAVYCTETNYKADVDFNFHSSVNAQECPDILSSNLKSSRHYSVFNKQPNKTVVKVFDAKNKLKDLLTQVTESYNETKHSDKTIFLEAPECGVGCGINFMIKPFIYALQNKMKIITPKSLWMRGAKNEDCKTKHGISCLFHAFSEEDDKNLKITKKNINLKHKFTQDDSDFFEEFSFKKNARMIIPEFKEFGQFWFISQITKFLLEPSLYLQNKINEVVSDLKLLAESNKPILALHVRMGDACSDPKKHEKGRNCDDISSFLPFVRDLVDEFGYKTVYLATDSEETVKFIEREKPFNINWVYNKRINRTKYKIFTEATEDDELSIEGVLFGNKKLKDAGFVAFDEMVDFLVDTLIMGNYATGLVGKFSSNMDRIVAALQYAQDSECIYPMVSLDSYWCFDFMVRSGKSFDGRTFYC